MKYQQCWLVNRFTIQTDVVDSDIPLLLSLDTMKRAKIKLDLEHDTAEILGETVNLNHTTSGHYCVPIDKSKEIPVENVYRVQLQLLDEATAVQCAFKTSPTICSSPVV